MTHQTTISPHFHQLIERLHPDRDNTDLIRTIACEDFSVLTGLVSTHRYLAPSIMAMIVQEIALDWTSDPEAAQTAFLTALTCTDPWVQREAREGLDEMRRENALCDRLALQGGTGHDVL